MIDHTSSHPTAEAGGERIELPGGWSLQLTYEWPKHYALIRPDGNKQTRGFTPEDARAFAAALASAPKVGADAPLQRYRDEIDAAGFSAGWLDDLAKSHPRIAMEEITLERGDVGLKVYWRNREPVAAALTFRDAMNFAWGARLDFRALSRPTAPASTSDPRDEELVFDLQNEAVGWGHELAGEAQHAAMISARNALLSRLAELRAAADVSTKPQNVNTSSERVEGTAERRQIAPAAAPCKDSLHTADCGPSAVAMPQSEVDRRGAAGDVREAGR